jgi:hypothetical protein
MKRFDDWLDKDVSSNIYCGDFVYFWGNNIITSPKIFQEFQDYKNKLIRFKDEMKDIINN